jgi:hypothetical protein
MPQPHPPDAPDPKSRPSPRQARLTASVHNELDATRPTAAGPRLRRPAVILSPTRKPDAQEPAETPEQVRETLWRLFQHRTLRWKTKKVKQDIGAEIAKLTHKIEKELPDRSRGGADASSVRRLALSLGLPKDFAEMIAAPTTDLAMAFLQEVGLAGIPYLGAIASAASMLKEGAKLGNTAWNQRWVGQRRKSATTAYVELAAGSLLIVLRVKFKSEMIRFGTYVGETAAGVVAPGVAAIPAAAVRLMRRLYVLYEDYQMLAEANKVLNDEKQFQTDCLVTYPVLGCHTIVEMQDSTLIGVIAGCEIATLTPEQRTLKILTHVQAAAATSAPRGIKFWRSETVLDNQINKITQLRGLAREFIGSAPYELGQASSSSGGTD